MPSGDKGYVIKDTICTFHHSSASNCTHLMFNGGAIFPAKEGVEYFYKHLTHLGDKDGKPRTNTKTKSNKR